ncbi:NAD-dependent epimerase [uncultured Algimonas sp.]|uniref:NAD-dependent epimerase n=1 Tax=uncultured Algimonas sp. TaxID=1547920 RepID=UPI00260914D2|nr:NAD-dependent epimerase [uncultured Algimonas sp.]
MKYLVTGSAGFIGNHVALDRLKAGFEVIGIDIVSDYYDVNLKEARLDRLRSFDGFTEERIDLADDDRMAETFARHQPDVVINLAAQAGVRYSLDHPREYVKSNLAGFLNVLEGCRHNGVKHLLYASTSSVYGANTLQPFNEHRHADHPLTFYAASKRANELMAHSYAHLFGLPCTGLRFFTVYGPWGRPDMALFKFTKGIIEDTPIDIYNNGQMSRDFTYIDDIAEGIVKLADVVPQPDPDWNSDDPDPCTSGVAPFRVYNIGNSNVVPLMTYIETLEKKLGKEAIRNFMPMQIGDVPSTCADTSDLKAATGFRPDTSVDVGISNFVDWYLEYYR